MRLHLAPALASTVAALALASGCGAFEEPQSAWTADEDAIAAREVAEAEEAAMTRLNAQVRDLGKLDDETATCIVDTVVGPTGQAALDLVDADTDATRHRAPIADAVIGCGAATDLAETWIPELTVDVPGLEGALSCVADGVASWTPGRMADLVIAGGLDDEETARDAHRLAGEIDRCDAGAAMMAAATTLHPQVGEDARTPSRWRCAAAAAPAGAFDELLDPAVTDDEARAAAADTRVAAWFESCP